MDKYFKFKNMLKVDVTVLAAGNQEYELIGAVQYRVEIRLARTFIVMENMGYSCILGIGVLSSADPR